jgi:hypothetical protein
MTALLFFLLLDAALLVSAAVLLLVVIVRRGRSPQYVALAAMLIVLAIGVWYTGLRNAPPLP